MDVPYEISRLIAARILGTALTDDENRRLDEWLQASPEHQETFKRVQNLETVARLLELEQADYGKKMATRFKQTFRLQKFRSVIFRRACISIGIVACFLIGLFVTRTYIMRSGTETQHTASPFVITPGETAATLTLADGRQIDVHEKGQEEMTRLLDSVAHASPKESANALAYYTLSIPAGGEFHCSLPDGTKVWLNSQSSLRFPETFESSERKVYLQGEAFFEVKKSAECPFIVSMSQGDIRVYGTRFNITDYENAPLSAVLVEGSIGFCPENGNLVHLHPSQRLTYNRTDGNVNIETVDTSIYTAWVEKRFVFKGQTLEEIMNTLARWYDFTPVFTSDNIRHIRLSGRLNRHDDIRILLQSYEMTAGIKFRIEGRTIFISQ